MAGYIAAAVYLAIMVAIAVSAPDPRERRAQTWSVSALL